MAWLRQVQMLPSLRGGRGLAQSAFDALPIIDVAALVDTATSSASARAAVGKQLDAACSQVGFFYIVNHGMPAAVTDGVIHHARRWFQLPAATKNEIALSPASGYRGYQALGTNVTRYDGGFVRDWHEGIDLYKEVSPQQAEHMTPSPIHGANPWPMQLPEFEAALRDYIDGCLHLGQALMRGIALGLGLPETAFEGGAAATTAASSYWVTRVIHYPPLPPDSAASRLAAAGAHMDRSLQLSCGEHSDYGMLTLVNQEAGLPALQVKNPRGEWIGADPVDGALVCNIGDMLRVWTGGRYTPTLHRVVNANPERSRISVPFFYEPAFDAVVEPLVSGGGGGGSGGGEGLAPRRYGEHLESKVLRNFELQEG